MNDIAISLLFSSIVAGAAPIILASIGETINERAGVINLSLDGSILLSAMVAFAFAYEGQGLVIAFLAGAVTGGLIAAIVGSFGIYLGQSQVAVGFVMTLTAKDMAYFFGNPYSRVYGPQASSLPIPLLKGIPLLGEVFFRHSIPVYLSMVVILVCWWYLYRTPLGLRLRSVGENPRAAYARGVNVRRTQFLYTIVGGLLVGLAGATISLFTKPGWGRPQGAEGTGWIALAIVIFGGWHPFKVALGAYLFSFLQVMGIQFQGLWESVPAQVFQVAPFPMMILALVLIHGAQTRSVVRLMDVSPWARRIIMFVRGSAPAHLGRPFQEE
ncbi:MAG: ABC transporter permease [Deltaproteobacteria bacterium]|nr:ABC transporter permease [Deltaproteobacteria bacterium]